ncbi:hypothetical protein [Tuberibacillus sp. Marseille-P3662]|uniref:hypothetical protein n=1 Tax=Tuberibacillus sp. Marseille-P3662 TaxID=1965358 RepID=UPI000A1C985B|nr:hypothetical protein [Tuberibacillus sp. Marseille-P3662]
MTLTAKDLYQKSVDMLAHLKTYSTTCESRDVFIEQLNQFIDERDQIIHHLPASEASSNNQWAAYLVDTDRDIRRYMNDVMADIQSDRQVLKQKKHKNKSYAHPFGISKDGMFLDQRK